MRWTYIFIMLMWTAISHSQPNPFITYTPRDGLVSARVHNAYQDSKGRIHFLTYGGLSVYDGVRFKNYTMRDGLGSDMVNDVIEIGHEEVSVILFEPATILNKGDQCNQVTKEVLERI